MLADELIALTPCSCYVRTMKIESKHGKEPEDSAEMDRATSLDSSLPAGFFLHPATEEPTSIYDIWRDGGLLPKLLDEDRKA